MSDLEVRTLSLQWQAQQGPVADGQTLQPGQPGVSHLSPPSGCSGPITASLVVPIGGINGLWFPYGDRGTLQKVVWRGKFVATPYYKPALLALVDRHLHNRLLLLAEPADQEIRIEWALDQAKACYRLHIHWPNAAGTKLLLSTDPSPVHKLADRIWRDFESPPAPAACFEPAYCTWYAFHGDMDQDRIERCAKLAAELGFGNLILDDGWSYDASQRVGAVLGPWHQWQGDWEPSPRKFPDFAGHVRRVREMGLRYTLWIAPFMVGMKSRSHQQLQPSLLRSWLDEGYAMIDPRNNAAVEHVRQRLEQLVQSYAITGFKVDYDYGLLGPGEVGQDVGEAYALVVRRWIDACRSVRPDFEWTLTPNLLATRLTSSLRCLDVPFDPESNRLNFANLWPMASRVALQYDPSLWSAAEPVSAVHRHVIPSLFGVPSVGAPILELPEDHLAALRSWMGFYRRHQAVLNQGELTPRWAGGDFQSFHRRLNAFEIAATFSSHPIAIHEDTHTVLINADDHPAVIVKLPRGAAIRPETADGVALAKEYGVGPGLHELDCPSGGVLNVRF
ncbi:MAG: alpha-galactosidase [Phycisphaerales bacterium]|nr:alpha-galactosidase [Phycisphaerales bacterium]